MSERCEEHAWVSVGVTVIDDQVVRVWDCERCPVWSREPLAARDEVAWGETWMAER